MRLVIATTLDPVEKAIRDRCVENDIISAVLNLVPTASSDPPSSKVKELICPNMILTTRILEEIEKFSAVGFVWTVRDEVGNDKLTQSAIYKAAEYMRQYKPAEYRGPFTMAVYNPEENDAINDKIKLENWRKGSDFRAWSIQPGALGEQPTSQGLSYRQFALVAVDIGLRGARHWVGNSHIVDRKQVADLEDDWIIV